MKENNEMHVALMIIYVNENIEANENIA